MVRDEGNKLQADLNAATGTFEISRRNNCARLLEADTFVSIKMEIGRTHSSVADQTLLNIYFYLPRNHINSRRVA